MHEHVNMHIYAVQTACDYACMCMWLCPFMLCSQFVTMYKSLSYATLCRAVILWLCMPVHVIMHIYGTQSDYNSARAWAMHIHAMQSVCDYACMWMWLCTSMPCSQIVTLHAWACDYACMCMWLCAPMLCSQLVTKHACAYDYAHLSYAVSLWLCMHVRVIMHICAMPLTCNYACMSMWLCIFMSCTQICQKLHRSL